MTTQSDPAPESIQPPEPPPTVVTAPAGSRLEQLQALYPALKAAADEAIAQLKAVTDGIKLELTALDANERRFTLAAADDRPALRLTWSVTQRLDSKRLRTEQPDLYAAYVKPSGSWTLKAGA